MQVSAIRENFLKFFETKSHTRVKSSSLIPHNDPTLLFANAGMNQFKDVFLGLEKRDYVRATSSQKCVRAGGKHNDLENVGYTARHHTFFEMLGNFSFGDYFKEDAIKFAWGFLTSPQWLAIDQNKLYVTVYHTDDEAYNIWHNIIGLSADRIIRIGDKTSGGSDNFWQMGETGPCGPCTEIFYDHGANIEGGLPGSHNEDGDRFIEIWNCVFMQYNRDEAGVLHKLPKPSVDTGMGIERISAVMQNVHSNYEIDLFVNLIKNAAKVIKNTELSNPSLKVIADHIRSISFLIADGVLPSNEGRGYVLRRIIRRAVRHGYKLGMRTAFLNQLVEELVLQMGQAYPELVKEKANIIRTILQEEEKFFQTIENGMLLLEEELTNVKHNTFSGSVAFKLYDTYGFPLDLTSDICREKSITVDLTEFENCMQRQKDMSKASGKFKMEQAIEYTGIDSKFSGYEQTTIIAKILAIYQDGISVDKLDSTSVGIIVLDNTVCYAESGGQIGDIGSITNGSGKFTITDTQKIKSKVFGHVGKVDSGTMCVGDTVECSIDTATRLSTTRNHSAAHLLHSALHKILGDHTNQKGSLVTDKQLRLDFAHDKSLTDEQIKQVEILVNQVIINNYPVNVSNMNYDDAIEHGAMALFGEKYDDLVRVVAMGDVSTELCGGTHVNRTGDIGFFAITSESGVAAGVRRIEATTGLNALFLMQNNMGILDQLRDKLKAQSNPIILAKLDSLLDEQKALGKQLQESRSANFALQVADLASRATQIHDDISLLVLQLDDLDNKALVEMTEGFKNKLGSSIVVLSSRKTDKTSFVVGVSKNLTNKYKAGDIINKIVALLGGKGGGRPDLAQAGAPNVSQAELDNALLSISKLL